MTETGGEEFGEGFPPCGPDTEHDLYTDEFEVTYVCEFVEGLGWGWRQIGRSAVDGEPPARG